METFSALLAICAGNSPVTSEFPAQRPVTRSFDFFSWICVWINGWVNNREAGDLRHHRAHYDVTVMYMNAHRPIPLQYKKKYKSRRFHPSHFKNILTNCIVAAAKSPRVFPQRHISISIVGLATRILVIVLVVRLASSLADTPSVDLSSSLGFEAIAPWCNNGN